MSRGKPVGAPPIRARKELGGTMLLTNMTKPTRRSVLRTGSTLVAASALPRFAFAADKPPIGTWPAGSSGIVCVHRHHRAAHRHLCGAGRGRTEGDAARGRAHQRGDPLIKKISPKTTKGVLGKEVKFVVADSEAKPNTAVQAQSRFISENKIVAMTGSTSSAVAVALNKLAQRERCSTSSRSPARTTPPARIACATASASASTARPRPRRSAR